MAGDRRLILFHSPQSRSAGALILLEELGADYELRAIDLKKNEQRQPEYLAVNPMGKVPALVHGGAVVTEQGAVYAYAADLYPEAGIAPAIGDALRGPYLRWLFFYGSSFEPAVVDRSLKREPAPALDLARTATSTRRSGRCSGSSATGLTCSASASPPPTSSGARHCAG